MRLTEEQTAKLELYNKTLEDLVTDLNKLGNELEVVSPLLIEAKQEVDRILTDPPKTEALLLADKDGNYNEIEQALIDAGTNPYLIFPDEIEILYNDLISPVINRAFPSIEAKYNLTYFNFNDSTINLITNEAYKNSISDLVSKIESKDIKQTRQSLAELDSQLLNLISDIVIKASIIKTILARGRVQTEEYSLLIESKEGFYAKPEFSSKIIKLSRQKQITTINSLRMLLKNNIDSITSELIEEVELINAIQKEEQEDVQLAQETNTTLDSLIKDLTLKDEEESLRAYIENIVTNKDDSFDRLINFEGTERSIVLQEAKDNFDSIFPYIFSTDPRLLTIYNNENYRKREEVVNNNEESESTSIPKVDAAPFNNDYHINWFGPFDKLTGANNADINIKEKIEELKEEADIETLNNEDIKTLNSKIDEVLSILILEIEPTIYTFYLSLDLLSNKLKEENRTDFLQKIEVETTGDFSFPYIEDTSEDEQSKGYRFLKEIKDKVKEEGVNVVENLIDKLVNIKRQFIEDKVEALNTLIDSNNTLALTFPDIQSCIDKLKEEETSFCEQVIEVIETQARDYFIDTTVSNESLGNIYKVLSQDNLFEDKYNILKDVAIRTYEPVNKATLPLDTQPNFFVAEQDLSITRQDMFKLWCLPSKRIEEAASKTRVQFLDEKFKQLVLSHTNNEVKQFNETKTFIINLIEQDLYVDVAAYRKGIEPFALEERGYPTKPSYYIPRNDIFNYDKISELKFNSLTIIDLLIKIHKSITSLELGNIEERNRLKELQEESNLKSINSELEKVNEENEKLREGIDLPKENWGIRISPANTSTRVTIENTEKTKDPGEELTKEEEVNKQEEYNIVSNQFNKSWYMNLLPAMSSNLPVTGGSQAPGVQPGLNFRVVNSLVKHKIPGFGPIYQPMGIDTINCTIIGCFTGADGFDKYKIGSIESFSSTGHKISQDLLGRDGRVGFAKDGFLNEYVTLYDSFDNYQTFFTEIVQPNKEIEVEINLRKNTSVLKNGSEGLFRDRLTGNPKFKGYIKRLDTYYVRSDRMWYILDVQLTTNTLTSKKCLDLTNIIEESKPDSSQLEAKDLTVEELFDCLFQREPREFKDRLLRRQNDYDILKNYDLTIFSKNDNELKFSINRKGYGIIYNEVKGKKELVRGPLYPSQTFVELKEENKLYNWSLEKIDRYLLKKRCIKDFKTSGNSLRNPVGEKLVLVQENLGPVIELGENQNRRLVSKILYFKRAVKYDTISGNLVEVEASKVKNEYSTKGVLLNSTDILISTEINQFNKVINSLQEHIEFVRDEEIDRCIDNEPTPKSPRTSGRKGEDAVYFVDPIKAKSKIMSLLKKQIVSNSKKENKEIGDLYFSDLSEQTDNNKRILTEVSSAIVPLTFDITENLNLALTANLSLINNTDSNYPLKYKGSNSEYNLEKGLLVIKAEHNGREVTKLLDVSVNQEKSSPSTSTQTSNTRASIRPTTKRS